MKKILLLSILFSTILMVGCGFKAKKENKESIKTEDKSFLKGLKKADKSDFTSISQSMLIENKIPIYTQDGKILEGVEVMKRMPFCNCMMIPYVNDLNELKAIVLRHMTNEEIRIAQGNNTRARLIGKEAMPFSLNDISGNSYSIKNLKGKIIVMNFWFISCKPCVMEIPELNKLVEKNKGKEIVFLGFALDKKPALQYFLQKTPFNYTIIPECVKISKTYEVYSYPTNIVIDKNSKITYFTSGLCPTTVSDLEKEIKKLLKN